MGFLKFKRPILATATDTKIENLGVGTEGVSTAKAHIKQASTTGAIPCMELEQDDVDQPFIEFDGNEAAGASTTVSTSTTSGAVQKHIQITVNGTKYWLAALADPS